MPSMAIERSYLDMIYLKEKVYAVGGGGPGASNSVDIYDSSSGAWTKKSVPFNVGNHCITQISTNQLILIGGRTSEVS